jgi:glycosyltransferase involved in cell wall biosynthesis
MHGVAQHADLGREPEAGTPLRWLKMILIRSARVLTRRQSAFNIATVSAMEDLVARIDMVAADASTRNELVDSRAYCERENLVASLRSEIVEIQQQLVLLGSGSTRPRDPIIDDLGPQSTPAVARPGSQGPEQPVGGLTLFGDWGATTGLAQAARRLSVALIERGGIDVSVLTHASGAPTQQSRVPLLLTRADHERRHPIELWMLNLNEMPAVPDELLRPPGRETYAIGVWYWELPSFPDQLRRQIERVDEIWVGTTFVKDSFQRVTSKPVRVIPAIVPELGRDGMNREDFGISSGEVVFLFTFDVNSMVARKNPAGFVEAFDRAFGESHQSARLVIKVLNLGRHPRVGVWLQKEVDRVSGVLIDEDLTDAAVADLIRCADVYVSLHRSEGFGFGMAEAMSLAKPVIATAYSGNLDFTTTSNSCQVGYRMTEISAADHGFDEGAAAVYRPGQMWADPDLDQAARWMRLLAADPLLRTTIGNAGRTTILNSHNPDLVVAKVRGRLAELRAQGIG